MIPKTTKDEPDIEFSRPFSMQNLKRQNVLKRFSATKTECRRLAERFNLVSIDFLVGNISISQKEIKQIRVGGRISARYTQFCVVTLDPIQVDIDEPISGLFLENIEALEEIFLTDPLEENFIELLENNTIDCGELLAQSLAISIDPYINSSDKTNKSRVFEEFTSNNPRNSSPFEVLRTLKVK